MAQSRSPLAVVVLAAGQGTRMKSRRSKMLHDVAGRPLLDHVLRAVEGFGPERIVTVVGRDAGALRDAFAGRTGFVVQEERRGTGHAVQQAEPALREFRGDVLLLYGDIPLIRSETLARMAACKAESGAELVMLTAPIPLPGLVVRDGEGRVRRIVEVTDATPEELRIREGNTGVYLVGSDFLWKALGQLDDRNEQGELYLTDIVERAVSEGRRVEGLRLEDAEECLGVNDRRELAEASAALRRRTLERLMEAGVTVVDPASTWIDVGVRIGADSVIEPGVRITGETTIGEACTIRAHCVIESSELDDECVVGPSAHLRPGSRLGRGVRIGNFVEVKNSRLADGVKADHLAYIGDADVGPGSSFGCGAITVNYDWERKHRTTIGAGVRIGCNANLVAPVTLEDGAYVAAGTTVTKTVPSDAIAVASARQRNLPGFGERRRARRGPREEGSEG